MRPPSFLGLYWSINGEVACEDHAPDTDNPRWDREGWAPIPLSSGKQPGARYQCQHCATDGGAVVYPESNTRPH
jgi:hypothetical protein